VRSAVSADGHESLRKLKACLCRGPAEWDDDCAKPPDTDSITPIPCKCNAVKPVIACVFFARERSRRHQHRHQTRAMTRRSWANHDLDVSVELSDEMQQAFG